MTEVELSAGVTCAHNMLYIMQELQSVELKVKLPILLEMDSKGAVHLVNKWNISGHTRHKHIKQYFLFDLKEEGLIELNIFLVKKTKQIFHKESSRTYI